MSIKSKAAVLLQEINDNSTENCRARRQFGKIENRVIDLALEFIGQFETDMEFPEPVARVAKKRFEKVAEGMKSLGRLIRAFEERKWDAPRHSFPSLASEIIKIKERLEAQRGKPAKSPVGLPPDSWLVTLLIGRADELLLARVLVYEEANPEGVKKRMDELQQEHEEYYDRVQRAIAEKSGPKLD